MPIWFWNRDRRTWKVLWNSIYIHNTIILIIALPLLIPYALAINSLKELILCSGLPECKVWGSNFLFSFLFIITGGPLLWYLINKHIDLILYKNKKRLRLNMLIVIILLIVAFIGIGIGFLVYTKTTKEYLEFSDPLHFDFTPIRLNYNEIFGVGQSFQPFQIQINRRPSCVIIPYIMLEDKTMIFLRGALNDRSFIEYLQKNKKIPPAIGPDYNCF